MVIFRLFFSGGTLSDHLLITKEETMKHKTFATIGILAVLLVLVFSTAAAQTGTPTSATPTPTTGPTQMPSKFLSHPIVQILSAYFGRETEDQADPTPTEPVPTDGSTPVATPTEAVPGQTSQQALAEEIAQYHEEGMGFGVLVKLYAMAEVSKQACADAPVATDTTETVCTPVTVDEMVTEFKSGSGMGALFKEYGKPAMLGVGHVRKAMQALQNQQATPGVTQTQKDHSMKPKDNNGQGNGKNK
jgi:hypothetical protein